MYNHQQNYYCLVAAPEPDHQPLSVNLIVVCTIDLGPVLPSRANGITLHILHNGGEEIAQNSSRHIVTSGHAQRDSKHGGFPFRAVDILNFGVGDTGSYTCRAETPGYPLPEVAVTNIVVQSSEGVSCMLDLPPQTSNSALLARPPLSQLSLSVHLQPPTDQLVREASLSFTAI